MLAVMETARRAGRDLVIPAGVVAQVWRGGSRQARLARFVAAAGVEVDVLTHARAKACGAVCGRTGTADIVDASVVVAARRHHATVITSDRADLETLDPDIVVLDC
ncbi:MAG: PIN domain-containing protein [Solirubrobacteraceae bacterium]